ncbi:MAG: hypothetical protein KA507_02925 [Candidatus Accumulibacter sp.]|nr:hypothetical protein [Accumulibacter sp.]
MNEVRRLRIKCAMEALAELREKIHKIRDDEDRAIAGGLDGSQDASDLLSEAGMILLVAIGQLDKAKKARNA